MTPSRVLLTIASSEESTMAASRARSSSVFRRSAMSRAIFEAPMIVPCASLIGDTVSEMGIRWPFLVRRTVSKWSILSPRRRRASTSASSARRSSGMIRVMFWPTASAAVYPKMLSAPRFHEVITPSSVLLTIASSEESTMAASSCRISPTRTSRRDSSRVAIFCLASDHIVSADLRFRLFVPTITDSGLAQLTTVSRSALNRSHGPAESDSGGC